jgi:hypothetical protein
MLWELWRVTRVEILWRLAFGTLGGLAVIALDQRSDKVFGAVVAMIFLVMPHYIGWVFLSRLNGGRAGFPLYLLYSRPVRTSVIVGLPMAYLTIVPAAIYLVSAFLLRVISGHPFPLLPVAAWIAVLNVVLLVAYWSSRNMVALMLGCMVPSVAWLLFAIHRLTDFPEGFDWHDSTSLWPTIFNFPLTDYAFIGLVSLASFGVALAAVARQRHSGAARVAIPRTVSGTLQVWFVKLFGFPCPASSATWAQVWFDVKPWLPLLAIQLVIATVGPLLSAVSVRVGLLRPVASIALGLALMGVFAIGANAFGIRYVQGRFRSPFDATQPLGSARLASLKILVRSICVLAALTMVSASIWLSLPSIAFKNAEKMRSWQRGVESAVAGLTGYQQIALLVVVCIGVVIAVTSLAAVWALWTSYSRRLNIAGSLLLLYGLALALLSLAAHHNKVPEFLPGTLFRATPWFIAGALFFATVYLLWRGVSERFLSFGYVFGAVLLSTVFAAAWLTMLRAVGMTANTVAMMSPMLLPLMASALGPWSLSRIRHM